MSQRLYVVHAYSGFEKSVQPALLDRIKRSEIADLMAGRRTLALAEFAVVHQRWLARNRPRRRSPSSIRSTDDA